MAPQLHSSPLGPSPGQGHAHGTGTGTCPIPAGRACRWPWSCPAPALCLAPCRLLGVWLPSAPHSLCGTHHPSSAKASSAFRPGQGAAARSCLSHHSPAFGLCSWGRRETHKNLLDSLQPDLGPRFYCGCPSKDVQFVLCYPLLWGGKPL